MNNKKKLLFTIDSLGIGGGEKSLVTLLNLIDYTKYEVDLQLFAYGGQLHQFVPKEVNILPPLNYTKFLEQPIYKQLFDPIKLIARISYSFAIRKKNMDHARRAVSYWKTVGKTIEKNSKEYDVGIAYAQGIPTFYTVDKVNAKKKLGWVNCRYDLSVDLKNLQSTFYKSLDKIILVSESLFQLFSRKVYPEFINKMFIMWDINNPEFIKKMSGLPNSLQLSSQKKIIMTVGRLAYSKGYDYLIETAKILKNKNINFIWYIIGEGVLRKEIEEAIYKNNLQKFIVLLGAKSNPYSYIKDCEIYVQTSRNESFCLTLAEARILNRPVVCTNFVGCEIQMKHEKNGLVTSFDPSDIADSVIRLMEDKELYNSIQEFQRSEKIGNTEEIQKFYDLIEN